jgi:hypothetical protein
VSGPTPLLDYFKRGEVARDVRMEAALGTLAPRAHEQLQILVMLLEDPDIEIRMTAEETLNKIPEAALQMFLARPDVPLGLREFFGDRGIFPDEMPDITAMMVDEDEPLLDNSDPVDLGEEDETRESATQKLAKMGFSARLKAAVKGSREMRAMLIRDPNKMISTSVLSSPKLSEPEVESFAKMASLSEDVLRIIATNRAWTKNYNIVLGLAKNPKTPVALSMQFLQRLSNKDLAQVSVDRNVSEALRIAARKKVAAARSGSGKTE